ncbi:SpoIIE family protein phosphatase [Streptomyces sp. NPDC058613]|uniref:SpoIIE family protein phosphatase n=1 Tax=Streptomyces sp. NPDC058613 TaxID=3346556 RepID=UPI00364FEF0E
MGRSCVYVVRDPHRSPCRVALAGHPPPVLVRSGQAPGTTRSRRRGCAADPHLAVRTLTKHQD